MTGGKLEVFGGKSISEISLLSTNNEAGEISFSKPWWTSEDKIVYDRAISVNVIVRQINCFLKTERESYWRLDGLNEAG